MTNNFTEDEDNNFPDESPSPSGKTPDQNDQNAPTPSSGGEVDPLSELRQNLYEEEQAPRPNQPKPDLLHRMTGNLASRRPPASPREPSPPRSRFGVRTSREPLPSDDVVPQEGDTAYTVPDEGQPARGTVNPANRRWGQSTFYDPRSESEDDEAIEEEKDVIELGPKSKVQPALTAPLHAYDSSLADEEEEIAGPREPKYGERSRQTTEDRKRLPSGFERQQQVSRFISYNPKRSFWSKVQEASPLEKALGWLLILAIIGVVLWIGYLYMESRQPGFLQQTILLPPSATTTPTVVVAPHPVGLRLPGGWNFQVGSGMMVDGKWAPTKSEWLVGTEVRRVIAIPWNKQIEAVVRTFETNDPINLEMNNGDVFIYKVKSVSYVSVTDSSILYDTHPSLAIILIRQGDNSRWVVIAAP